MRFSFVNDTVTDLVVVRTLRRVGMVACGGASQIF